MRLNVRYTFIPRLTMRRFLTPIVAVAAFVAVVSCHDLTTESRGSRRAPPARSTSSPAALLRFPCFTSELTSGGAYPYRYRRAEVAFPRSVVPATGATRTFRYRVLNEEGAIEFLANCRIPASDRALDFLVRRLRIPREAIREEVPEGAAAMDCVGEKYDPAKTTCQIEGITVVVKPTVREPTDLFECVIACGGTGGTPTTGPTGGGLTSCAICEPEAPILTCTPTVVRENPVSCDVTSGGVESATTSGWLYEAWGGALISAPGGSSSWRGLAVAGGRVTATMADGTKLVSSFAVTNRDWSWAAHQASDWRLSEGTAPVPVDAYGDEEPVQGARIRWGWNCNAQQCGALRRVQPDVLSLPTAGYAVQVVGGGPNAGMYYVSSVHFQMDRATGINRDLTGAGRRRLLEGSQAEECRQAMGLQPGTPVWVNFYLFNEQCKQKDVDEMIRLALVHEGYGTTGSNGHESQGRIAATQPTNDLYALVEPLTSTKEDALHKEVQGLLKAPQAEIETVGADTAHVLVKGNWSGTFWIWSDAEQRYVMGSASF